MDGQLRKQVNATAAKVCRNLNIKTSNIIYENTNQSRII